MKNKLLESYGNHEPSLVRNNFEGAETEAQTYGNGNLIPVSSMVIMGRPQGRVRRYLKLGI